MTHPGFARRFSDGDSAAGFIAAAKCREVFKAVVETGGAYASGKPRKSSGRSGNGEDGNGKDGGDRPDGAARGIPKTPATRRKSACTR